jgi:hypothetical protein
VLPVAQLLPPSPNQPSTKHHLTPNTTTANSPTSSTIKQQSLVTKAALGAVREAREALRVASRGVVAQMAGRAGAGGGTAARAAELQGVVR